MSDPVSTAKLMADLHAVVRDAEALLHATASDSSERIEAIRSRAADSLQQAKSRLDGMEEQALQGVRDAAAATQEYIKKNPWQTVAIAAGMGLLLGLLWRNRD